MHSEKDFATFAQICQNILEKRPKKVLAAPDDFFIFWCLGSYRASVVPRVALLGCKREVPFNFFGSAWGWGRDFLSPLKTFCRPKTPNIELSFQKMFKNKASLNSILPKRGILLSLG